MHRQTFPPAKLMQQNDVKRWMSKFALVSCYIDYDKYIEQFLGEKGVKAF